ncbi:hypothetical protein HZ326_19904 [Fusarium oxysporum f. sp. albedinis]|nr:hypothetical protein HZ326_19904 [Fusarium oxysporum f. sp. albedinis]
MTARRRFFMEVVSFKIRWGGKAAYASYRYNLLSAKFLGTPRTWFRDVIIVWRPNAAGLATRLLWDKAV